MIRRLYTALPGPPAARIAIMVVVVAVVLVLLVVLFEWAGQFLDTGGTIG